MIAIIKPVGSFCNIRCSYCFYHHTDQSNAGIMSYALLDKFTKEYIHSSKRNKLFIWHGGEPTLAGLEYFRKVVELQDKYKQSGQKIRNAIQTNGTTINDRWAKFFQEHDFSVGVSIDGCFSSHGMFRKNKAGKNSFKRTYRGIKKLEDYGINVGFIQTLTSSRIPFLAQDFDFFYDILQSRKWAMGTYLDIEGLNQDMLDESLSNEELSYALKRTAELWFEKDDNRLIIRELENLLFGVLGKRPSNCHYNGSCGQYFCMEMDGKIYPCDRFSSQKMYCWGDLNRESLQEIWEGENRKKYLKAVNKFPVECKECKWFTGCHNGCPSHRIGGLSGHYFFCQSRKEMFAFCQREIENHFSLEGGEMPCLDKLP